MYCKICKECGATLDAGEQCDCQAIRTQHSCKEKLNTKKEHTSYRLEAKERYALKHTKL